MPELAPSWATSPRSRKVMQGNRSRDTRPELALRSALHRRGLRYRVAAKPVAGLRRSADLVFASARVAVFVDGCFWHGCPLHYVPSLSNTDYWANKIDGNRQRDKDTDDRLIGEGWLSVRVWAHEPVDLAADRVASIVASRTAAADKPR
jgi:DNA mismatch endonuclease, patch repair protein